MNGSWKQYRRIDLGILLVLLVCAEILIAVAARDWFPHEAYVLSPTIAVVCIVMMRWNGYAAVQAVGGAAALCAASGANGAQFAVYGIGNCFALAALLLLRVFGKERVRASAWLTLLFTAAAFSGAQLGRWLVGLLLGGSTGDLVQLFTTDSLSLLFAVVTVQLARRLDGVFEDQIHYLVRTQDERNRRTLPDEGDTEYGERH